MSKHAIYDKVSSHLRRIYDQLNDNDLKLLTESILDIIGDVLHHSTMNPEQKWSEKDVISITYADSIKCESEKPFKTLKKFFDNYLKDTINCIHVLPFFPYMSDDGFSVLDYSSVNEALGAWNDVEALSKNYKVMADVVINHCSARSQWFQNFQNQIHPGKDYFATALPTDNLSKVVRPRESELLKAVDTPNGKKYVWCTFSHDQVDFDFKNPAVLMEFIKIMILYSNFGVKIFRLDAVAFLWKKPGTSSINLPQTHEIIRLFRTIFESISPETLLITETNIPNRENLSYFGNGNEAHCIYNFSLPPLLINTLITGNSRILKTWMISMPPARFGTAYFNFIASHDGIGLRPAEGLLSEDEIENLVQTMVNFGGLTSARNDKNGRKKYYEINISLFDALKGTEVGTDEYQIDRFVCAHEIMIALEGIPGLYIHSLLGTRNNLKKVDNTGQNRSINRHQWNYKKLTQKLDNHESEEHVVYKKITSRIELRKKQCAFHPNATQFTLHLSDSLFGFWRQSICKSQNIFCISNISTQKQDLFFDDLNLIENQNYFDLIENKTICRKQGFTKLDPYQTLWISNSQN